MNQWILDKLIVAGLILGTLGLCVIIAISPAYIRYEWINYQEYQTAYQKSFQQFKYNHEVIIRLGSSDLTEDRREEFYSFILDQYRELQRIKRLKDWEEGSVEYIACSYYTEMLIQIRTAVQLDRRTDGPVTYIETPYNWIVSQQ